MTNPSTLSRAPGTLALAFLAVASLPLVAPAAVIFEQPVPATTVTFDPGVGSSGCTSGPQTAIDAGLSISSDGDSCFPYSGAWTFGDNGEWGSLSLIGDGSGNTTLTINLGGLYSSVGGFMNYQFFSGHSSGVYTFNGYDPTIAALDADGHVIESYDLFWDPNFGFGGLGNGHFAGFTESSNEIAYFQISGDGIAMHNISLGTPEPTTWLLCGVGLLAAARRRHTMNQ